jgi:hypothetical protein
MEGRPIEDLANRFMYHPPQDDDTRKAHEHVRDTCLNAAKELTQITPPGREQALMVTHLEQTMFWANAAIARKWD